MKTIIFDLDGTLTESKAKVTPEVVQAISDLQGDWERDVVVISGCAWSQFQDQFLSGFGRFEHNKSMLHLMPTCGAQLYEYGGVDSGWYQEYNNDLSLREKATIFNSWVSATIPNDFDCDPYGEIAEDRGSQITFSMCGQEAPLEIKKKYDPDVFRRTKIAEAMRKYLPEFEVRIGGTTSIDVTKKGIDKAFGVLKIIEYLHIDKEDVVFIGDALFEGGNDYPVKTLGIKCIPTTGPQKTLEIIDSLRDNNAAV
jgi:HAD superfamily hydrolase (TIGR01484 family)